MYKKYGVCIKKKNKCISKQTITQQFVREETSNEKLSCRNHVLFFFFLVSLRPCNEIKV